MGDRQQQREIPAISPATGGLKLPPGYRFIPRDYELCYHLHNKITNGPVLIQDIKDVDIYKHDPKTLSEMYPSAGEKQWYFFTPRSRKYPNGKRPNRTVGSGYWKATGAEKDVENNDGEIVGRKNTLVFHQGKHQESVKTNWIMHEFTIGHQSSTNKRDANDMKLNDWVLCRIYEKAPPKPKVNQQQEEGNHPVDETATPNHLQAEEAINTKIQLVESINNEDFEAVPLNHENVRVVNNDDGNNGNLGASEYTDWDEELSRYLDFPDHLAQPSLDYAGLITTTTTTTTTTTPDWPFLANSNLSRAVSEEAAAPLSLEQGALQPVMENYPIIHQRHQQEQAGHYNHAYFHQQAPAYYNFTTNSFDSVHGSAACNPDCNQLMPRKRRC